MYLWVSLDLYSALLRASSSTWYRAVFFSSSLVSAHLDLNFSWRSSPPGGSYWAWIFPATILSTIGIDLSTILMIVFITTNFSSSRQGLAGEVINSVLQLGVPVCLVLTDLIQSSTVE